MIYVPNKEEYKCYVVQSSETIRAYKEIPRQNTEVDYRDYYFSANYIYRDGTQTFGQYTTLPVCLDNNTLSSDVRFRNDYADILIIFVIYAFFGFYIPFKLIMRLFKKGRS